MSMGGKGPEVLVTLTTDHGKILEGLHRTKAKIGGTSHLATGIQIAGVRNGRYGVSGLLWNTNGY
jgi:26S proteasome regulatory subunit N10